MDCDRWSKLVLLAASLLMLHRLSDPPSSYQQPGDRPTYVHDECYQAFTAERYLRGDRQAWSPTATRQEAERFSTDDMTRWTEYEWVHPPGAKLVMAAFIALLGFHPMAFRLGSTLFGALLLAVSWRLARRMRGPRFGLLALVLLSCDGLVFVMARIAMNDIYVAACTVTAIYLLYRYWTAEAQSLRWLVAAGAAFGVGLSMKWSAAPLWAASAIAVAVRVASGAVRGGMDRRETWRSVGAWSVAFVAAPLCIYLASYIPYFCAGYGWRDLAQLQFAMWSYHHNLGATHSQSSTWWQWPWIGRPVWFFLHHTADGFRVIYAMGNPLLWWAFEPSLAWVFARWLRQRRLDDAVILLGFGGSWLPWAFVGRVTFLQYLLPAVPFGAMAVATVLEDLARRFGRRGRLLGYAYAVACLAVLVNFYPFWSGTLVTHEQLDSHRWYWFQAWR
jgi:dolichyl-phosphate-mannose--protein O-mannosyl transferase